MDIPVHAITFPGLLASHPCKRAVFSGLCVASGRRGSIQSLPMLVLQHKFLIRHELARAWNVRVDEQLTAFLELETAIRATGRRT